MLYNASDYSCTGPILRNFTSNFPTTCASVSATQPAGRLTTYSFGDVLPFHDGCARPTDQVGFVDGQCYRSRYPQSFVFRSCDQSGEYGYIEGYFATSNCTGPSVFITLIFGPTPPTCNIFPSNQTYSTQCFPSLIAPPAVAPLPKGNAVLCYQASLTEYVIDFKAFSSALASGTGTATIVAFVATGELKLDVAFTGLSSPTDDLGISFEVPSPISKDNIKFTNGIPFNVTSGVYSNTTSIAGNVLQDLVAEVEGGARISVSTVLGFLYGEFSRLEPGSDQHIAHCQARPEPKNLRAVAF